ncbi:stage II sporulation protein R [Lachnoclostridium phytofermentans]|uniref:Stage II sporulation protein R n=1 Tax=Lachnoclostridium phytofermentans (strain ATCC 700394 / DSM 18823 / ISDg) TaxID=357809 RepID=A9KKE8_LACP7|nr:stage II sporulation protein R [Lachnoclostridium phytofermentans]ABX44139.1 stage II sporulation protein R [Lachnoclostridium phytofermentans ISDg]
MRFVHFPNPNMHEISNRECFPKKLFISYILPFALAFLITLYALFGAFVSFAGSPAVKQNQALLQEDLAKQLLRFHILGNSDSEEDQDVKLYVKEGLMTYLIPLLEDCTDKESTINVLMDHLIDIEKEASRLLAMKGYYYGASAAIDKSTFPIKVYGDITLPAGEYDALKIKLGKAQGRNWWCILFPNLCFVDATYSVVPEVSKQQLKSLLTEEEYTAIIKEEKPNVVVKFKLWDYLSKLF